MITCALNGKKYCCNLHGACGGKAKVRVINLLDFGCNLHGACGGKVPEKLNLIRGGRVAICTGRVEAKITMPPGN